MAQKTKPNGALFIIIGLIVGAVGVFTYMHFASTSADLGISQADVHKIDDVYVYIESDPIAPHTTVGTISADDLNAIADSLGIGKKQNALQIISNAIKTGRENLAFEEKLKVFVQRAKQQYGDDAQGLVFVGDLRSATVVKF